MKRSCVLISKKNFVVRKAATFHNSLICYSSQTKSMTFSQKNYLKINMQAKINQLFICIAIGLKKKINRTKKEKFLVES